MGTRASCIAAFVGAAALGACVPADEAGGLGSVQFTLVATDATVDGVVRTIDGWSIRFDRVVLGFKTMTIGKIGVKDTCAYRGRGASSDVVFDPRKGIIQSFNGIKAVDCPDVGIIFGPPDSLTTLAGGAVVDDIVDLASDVPAHGIVEATAVNVEPALSGFADQEHRTLRFKLRLDSTHTSTRFGGCQSPFADPTRGVRILAGDRDDVTVRFGAEALFRESTAANAGPRVMSFWGSPISVSGAETSYAVADTDHDGVVTMDELERVPLSSVAVGNYKLPNGSNSVSFAEYIRVLFRFAFTFHDETGACVGNEPGSEEGGQPAP